MSTVTHASWCTDHVHQESEIEVVDMCQARRYDDGVELTFNEDPANPGRPQLEVYSPSETYLTAAEAREVAAALLAAAEALEAS